MTPFQAIVLGVVQGLTEFLPVSSSGHLILVPYFLHWPDQGLSFDIATHTGTLLAIVAYFHRDLRDLIVGFFTGQPRSSDGEFAPRRLAWAIAAGTIPAGLVGYFFKDWIETYARNPLLIAGTTFFYGLLLFWADRTGRQERTLSGIGWSDALVIGCAQALALVPGTSRSGITITAALLLGLTRPAAARFSFLLIVPISVLVAAKDAKDLMDAGVGTAELAPMAIGLAVSAVVGYAVIAWLLAWLRRRTLTVFVVYRVLLAALIVVTAIVR
ncbi:MAG TPA: undecaprenyl-diphosphate phosphatase [Thermoanaerobaculia bacterium]|jgi:undecaprenyl-diphosphatase|nr:undecaprenyl-diphosphate phosphatase [Thermoanaerobaculia bacterium]